METSFQVAQRLKSQSVAYSFINDIEKPLILEMSYGFGTKGIFHCPGYYTSDLQWYANPEPVLYGWMVDDLVDPA